MSTLSSYKGSVTLVSGLTGTSTGYPLMEAHDILIDNDNTRLDGELINIKNRIGMTDNNGISARIKNLEGSIGEDNSNNTVKGRITALENIGAVNVSVTKNGSNASNGHIYIDGTDVIVYDSTNIENDYNSKIGTSNDAASAVGSVVWPRLKNAENDINILENSDIAINNNIENIRDIIGSDSIENTVKGRIKAIEDDIGDPSTQYTIKGDINNINNEIEYLNKNKDFINIDCFNVAGDGETDDTLAIQQALNECTRLKFNPTTYKISKTYTNTSDTIDEYRYINNIGYSLICNHDIEIDFNGATFILDEDTPCTMFLFTGSVIGSAECNDYTRNDQEYSIPDSDYTNYSGFGYMEGTNLIHESRGYYHAGFACEFYNGKITVPYPINVVDANLILVNSIRVHLYNLGNFYFNNNYDNNVSIKLLYNCGSRIINAKNSIFLNDYDSIDIERCLHCSIEYCKLSKNTMSPAGNTYLIAIISSSFCTVNNCNLYNERWHCWTTGGHQICYKNLIKDSTLKTMRQFAICDHENGIGTIVENCVSTGILVSGLGIVKNCTITPFIVITKSYITNTETGEKTPNTVVVSIESVLRFTGQTDKYLAYYTASDITFAPISTLQANRIYEKYYLSEYLDEFGTKYTSRLHDTSGVIVNLLDSDGRTGTQKTFYLMGLSLNNIHIVQPLLYHTSDTPNSSEYNLRHRFTISQANELNRSVIRDIYINNCDLYIYGFYPNEYNKQYADISEYNMYIDNNRHHYDEASYGVISGLYNNININNSTLYAFTNVEANRLKLNNVELRVGFRSDTFVCNELYGNNLTEYGNGSSVYGGFLKIICDHDISYAFISSFFIRYSSGNVSARLFNLEKQGLADNTIIGQKYIKNNDGTYSTTTQSYTYKS